MSLHVDTLQHRDALDCVHRQVHAMMDTLNVCVIRRNWKILKLSHTLITLIMIYYELKIKMKNYAYP